MNKKDFVEQISADESLYDAYHDFLQIKKNEMGADSQEFLNFEKWYTHDFARGIHNDKRERNVIMEGDNLIIREAHIEDSEFMNRVESDADNSPWVATWPLGWRIAKFGDASFYQVIVERKDGTPIGFIIFCDMHQKENAVQLKRIAIIDKGKGYGKETLYLAQKIAFDLWNTRRLYLTTKVENTRAQAIYKATGFVPEMPDPCWRFHMDREDYEKLK